jgi:hypothetical protein
MGPSPWLGAFANHECSDGGMRQDKKAAQLAQQTCWLLKIGQADEAVQIQGWSLQRRLQE